MNNHNTENRNAHVLLCKLCDKSKSDCECSYLAKMGDFCIVCDEPKEGTCSGPEGEGQGGGGGGGGADENDEEGCDHVSCKERMFETLNPSSRSVSDQLLPPPPPPPTPPRPTHAVPTVRPRAPAPARPLRLRPLRSPTTCSSTRSAACASSRSTTTRNVQSSASVSASWVGGPACA